MEVKSILKDFWDMEGIIASNIENVEEKVFLEFLLIDF